MSLNIQSLDIQPIAFDLQPTVSTALRLDILKREGIDDKQKNPIPFKFIVNGKNKEYSVVFKKGKVDDVKEAGRPFMHADALAVKEALTVFFNSPDKGI